MRGRFSHQLAVMDWYNRKIVTWRLSNSIEADCCVEALKQVIAEYGKPMIMSRDQGRQFSSFKWIYVLKVSDGSFAAQVIEHPIPKSDARYLRRS